MREEWRALYGEDQSQEERQSMKTHLESGSINLEWIQTTFLNQYFQHDFGLCGVPVKQIYFFAEK